MSIGKVQIDIEEFLLETSEPCLDDRTGNEWLKRFRDTLQFKGRKANPLPFGIDCIIEAEGFNAQQAVKRMSGVVKAELVKNGNERPTSADIEKALNERYGSEYITYKTAIAAKEAVAIRRERIKQKNIADSLGIKAGAPTREDGESKPDSGNAGNLESATPAKPSLAYSGKNGLVRLTDDEYALLLQELGNKRKADRLIDDLDYKLAEGATFRQPHLHVLTHWQSYREDKAAEAAEMAKVNADARAEAYSKRGYKTAEERQQEELAKINDFCTGLRNGTIKIAKEG